MKKLKQMKLSNSFIVKESIYGNIINIKIEEREREREKERERERERERIE
jgi:hypothetical protein